MPQGSFFSESGTSPPASRRHQSADFLIQGHGTVYLLHPLTDAAHEWVESNIDPKRQYFGSGIAVEHRYLRDIVLGAIADGLRVR